MKELPILMRGDMVRATLDDRKTKTRRVVKPNIIPIVEECFRVNGKWCNYTFGYDLGGLCPYGRPGDRLWVRETWATAKSLNHVNASHLAGGAPIEYRADQCLTISGGMLPDRGKWRPSIFMPRWISRITLEVVSVMVQRLKDISADDAISEGIRIEKGGGLIEGEDCYMMTTNTGYMRGPGAAIAAFWNLWDSINSERGYGWDVNPWVWVIEFKRVKP
jgi:hypothetical protein